MFEYRVFEEKLNSVESGEYIGYGIKVFEISECGERCMVALPDVSVDRDFVLALADLCNRGGLSPTHLFDVVEDFLP